MTFYADGWNFNTSVENESVLKPLCEQVEQHLQILKEPRLYRYFARTEDPALLQANGEHYRGFYCHVSEKTELPSYLFWCLYPPNHTGNTFREQVAFDDLIYIRHTTCADPTGFVATYAHELQHFIQHRRSARLLRANNVLYFNLKQFESNATASDIPTEREANIVSKRVAEAVCGAEAVKAFADAQVRRMESLGNVEQRDRWVFFRDVPPSTSYDVLGSTLPFVEKYKAVMDFGFDVSQPEWWLGPLED